MSGIQNSSGVQGTGGAQEKGPKKNDDGDAFKSLLNQFINKAAGIGQTGEDGGQDSLGIPSADILQDMVREVTSKMNQKISVEAAESSSNQASGRSGDNVKKGENF